MKAREAADRAREEKIKERDEKIQRIMSRMGEAGVKGDKDKQLRLKAEREYIDECIAKDELAHK